MKGLGNEGDVVKVSDGYETTLYLGFALQATKANLRMLKDKRNHGIESEELVAAEKTAKLENSVVTVRSKAGEGGRLFGSVTAKDIAGAIEKALGIAVDRRRIELEEPIKTLGSYSVLIRLHPEVSATVRVEVESQAEGEK